jgi:hypothetical protein
MSMQGNVQSNMRTTAFTGRWVAISLVRYFATSLNYIFNQFFIQE